MSLSIHEKWYKFCPNCKNKLGEKLVDKRIYLSCSKCNFIFWNNPKPVVSALLQIDIIYSGTFAGDIKFSGEDQGYEFFLPNNLPDKIAYKHREAISDWLKIS